jgi:hypothetical protein
LIAVIDFNHNRYSLANTLGDRAKTLELIQHTIQMLQCSGWHTEREYRADLKHAHTSLAIASDLRLDVASKRLGYLPELAQGKQQRVRQKLPTAAASNCTGEGPVPLPKGAGSSASNIGTPSPKSTLNW